MKNDWWFKFQYSKWDDPELVMCTLETQGFWLRVYTHLRKQGQSSIKATVEDLAKVVRGTEAEVRRSILDLRKHKAADVTLRNAQNVTSNTPVTLTSRSLVNELSGKEKTRLRVQKHRQNASVTPKKRDRVISKSKKKEIREEKEEEAATTKPKLSDADWLESLQQKAVYSKLDIKDEYERAEIWAEVNNRQCTRRFFISWINRAKPIEAKASTNGTTNGYDPKKDILSAEYEMERPGRMNFEMAADLYFVMPDNIADPSRERYDRMKAHWLETSGKGHESEIEEYERSSYKFRQRFGEAGPAVNDASLNAGRG